MADYQQYLAILEAEPENDQALAALEVLAADGGLEDGASRAFDAARKTHRDRGAIELVARLLEIELRGAKDQGRRADLLLEKGRLYADEFLDADRELECLKGVLEIRPDDTDAQEAIANLDLLRGNWERIVEKYLAEAKAATDRQLATEMYRSAAKTVARYKPGAPETEQYLRKAIEVEPKNRAASLLLERLLRAAGRWEDLARLLELRVDVAAAKEDRVQALLALADLARTRLGTPATALDHWRKVLAIDPGHPRAMQALVDAYSAEENWPSLAKIYEAALKVRQKSPEAELALLLQVAMISWKRLVQLDAAEEFFRRVRKVEPAHPAMLDFYREYHKSRGEGHKLLTVLQAAQKAEQDPGRRAALSHEMAGLAETEVGNPEKAIDSWKAILRQDPRNSEGRVALKRLYYRTEKWNALLDLLKEEIEQFPAGEEAGRAARVERLLEVVAIYRDKLNLDMMVINTYNTLLALAPDHAAALDALAAKYEQLGRWNDLTNVLGKKAAAPSTAREEKIALLRRIASLWADRSGNHAQAIKPLEELLALDPADREAGAKLKDIYAKRRQWRALIDLMGRELPTLAEEARRNQVAEMAQLASDKLGDLRTSIALWNRVLENDEKDALALASLAALYEKEKRWPALAEIFHRQVDVLKETGGEPKAIVAILERLGSLYAERLEAPAQAARAFASLLELSPGHGKSMRVLRELYAQAGDLDALERLYGGLGAWEDLLDVFYAVADRGTPERRLPILERAARLAETRVGSPERIVRAHERILAVDPQNLAAAKALVPLYRKGEKWARLLSTYEIVLGHASDKAERLALHVDIRKLCEEKIGSKAMAFQWAAAAYDLAPDDEGLLKELARLGAEADAWERVAEILGKRADDESLPAPERVRLTRELGRILAARLHKPEDARTAWEKVLAAAPDDPEAMAALEDIHTQQGRWADVLVIFRRRSELEKDQQKKLDLLFKIAFIEEERVGDLEAASKTYGKILEIDRRSQRALRALSKVQGARGDAEGLALALELELQHADEVEQKVALLLRLGNLYEERLGKRAMGFERYRAAFALSPGRREVHAALERFMEPAADEKVTVASLLAPVFDRADEHAKLVKALDVLRGAEADEAGKLALDRRLYAIHTTKLNDPLAAYEVAERIFAAAPGDGQNRRELERLAAELAAFDDLVKEYEKVLAAVDPADTTLRHALTTELAEILDERLAQPVPAEAAWRRVLDLDPADRAAYAALEKLLRVGGRWDDLREILVRHEQNTPDTSERRELLLSLCDLYEGVLEDETGAAAAYRRVLEVDPGSMRAYKALERLYERASQHAELEGLLAQEAAHVSEAEQLVLTMRRAELRAGKLADRAGAIDLVEEILARDSQHGAARKLLEALFDAGEHKLRVARILRPRYEADGQWRDVVRMLRGERAFASSTSEAAEMLGRIGHLEEQRLADDKAAYATWSEVFRLTPEDDAARAHLRRLAQLLDQWTDTAAAYEEVLGRVAETDTSLRARLIGELAKIYDVSLGDVNKATSAYERLLEVDPGDVVISQPAAVALERLYGEEEKWPQLIEVLRRQTEWSSSPELRHGLVARIAQLEEVRLADVPAAIKTWRELLADDAENRAALDALERLHAARDEHRELVEILRRRVELTPNGGRRALLWRIAELSETRLNEVSEANAAYLEILETSHDDVGALAELARLYRTQERFGDLVEIDERRLALAQDRDQRAQLRMELGELLAGPLARPEEALERFRQILAEDASHPGARAAVEKLLGDSDLRLRAAEILAPIYEVSADHEKLVKLYELEAESLDDVRDRLVRLKKIAALREGPLADGDGAYQAVQQAARLAVAEPEFQELLAQLMKLAFEQDKVTELVALYRELAPDVLDASLQRRMYLDVADLARGRLRDLDLAREYYKRVLDAQPDDPRALTALELIYRESGEHQALRDILRIKSERAEDLDGRVAAVTELAVLAEEKLGETDEAMSSWEQVLELEPANIDATSALERLYTAKERWIELAELLEKRLGFAEVGSPGTELEFAL